jgi:hypothetical protein
MFIIVWTRAFYWTLTCASLNPYILFVEVPFVYCLTTVISETRLTNGLSGVCAILLVLSSMPNVLAFYCTELLASPNTCVEGPPFVACQRLFCVFAATEHIWRSSCPSATRERLSEPTCCRTTSCLFRVFASTLHTWRPSRPSATWETGKRLLCNALWLHVWHVAGIVVVVCFLGYPCSRKCHTETGGRGAVRPSGAPRDRQTKRSFLKSDDLL